MILNKMKTEQGPQVSYFLRDDEKLISMNQLLGNKIELHYTGNIFCQNCNKKTRKSFNQGYCFPCSQKLAECDICIVRPERCHFDEGTCREPEWGEKHCMQDHFVYIANSSGLKVGITRAHQVPTRWMDQGAIQAIRIFRTESRYLAGLIEVAISAFISDKTNWRQMLKGDVNQLDMAMEAKKTLEISRKNTSTLQKAMGGEAIQRLEDEPVFSFTYPVLEFPKKLVTLDLEKTQTVAGLLMGIKGQYLILDCGVINIRKFTGYEVALTF